MTISPPDEPSLPIEKSRTAFLRRYNLTDLRLNPTPSKEPVAHQKEALERLRKWYETKHPSAVGGIVVIPTGGGKTFVAVRFLCSYPLSHPQKVFKVLWLAESHHLLEQAFFSFSDSVAHIKEPRRHLITRVVSGAKEHFPVSEIQPSDDVVMGTLRTISLAYKNRHPQLHAFIDSAGDNLCVVFDEAHHAPAPSYRELVHDNLRKQCRHMLLLGMTATPIHTDKPKARWLKQIFPQEYIYQVEAARLMSERILAKPVCEEPKTDFTPNFNEREYRKWLITNRDLPEEIITILADNRERNEFIARTYANNKEKYKKTIMFADRWFQCDQLREFLIKRDVRADVVYTHIDADPGSTEARNKRKKGENAIVLDKFRNGHLDVLINVRMLTEGTDVPDVQSVFLTRQTTSNILMTQMIGRGLRGPKFGGTEEAYIVSFIDDWKQLINWAKYESLPDGTPPPGKPEPRPHVPIEAISIELVRRLSRQMDSGINVASHPFFTLLPKGWYKVEYQTTMEGTDEIQEITKLVMIFDSEEKSYSNFIEHLLGQYNQMKLGQFKGEDVLLKDVYNKLRDWHQTFFSACQDVRFGTNQIDDLFVIARHVAQNDSRPIFYEFDARSNHDLDIFAQEILAKNLGISAADKALFEEYERSDRYWNTIYYRYDQFKSQFDSCVNRILHIQRFGEESPSGRAVEEEESKRWEMPQEQKELVKQRDGYKCQCCGEDRKQLLQVDHIVSTYFRGEHEISNLQTLCKTCNGLKGIREINFFFSKSSLKSPPEALPAVSMPRVERIKDVESWKKFVRRTLNFFYQSSAVNQVLISEKGTFFHHWTIELKDGNDPLWIRPHLKTLLEQVRDKKTESRLGFPSDITVKAPNSAISQSIV
jgi:ATP-dependent helicase IRC3